MACNGPSKSQLSLLKVMLMGITVISCCYNSCRAEKNMKTFIVQTMHSSMPAAFASPTNWYRSTLASVREQASKNMADTSARTSEDDSSLLIYTYHVAMHGFAARLTEQEAESLRKVPGFLSVIPDKLYKLQTTHTPEFLGLTQQTGLWPKASFGRDVIIGVIDTGVWPESKSFDDSGMGPIPQRWRGHCVDADDFKSSLCNKKLIGAKYFLSTALGADADADSKEEIPGSDAEEYRSPRDVQGHGTHAASTAAGSPVANASFFGYADGVAQGLAPGARIATYKACWKSLSGCMASDLLAAMEEAISDGVDVISLSLGGISETFFEDPIAIGSFGALDHGILVSCAAGNSGPFSSSILNNAPWLLTVAASTVDRKFPATVMLGNGAVSVGQSLYTGEKPKPDVFPLVSMGRCSEKSLETQNVAGKIVICEQQHQQQQSIVAAAGGAAEILVQQRELGQVVTSSFLLPTINVEADEGAAIRRYAGRTATRRSIRRSYISHRHATAAILLTGTQIGKQRAPAIPGFSSRGPNSIVPSILKPDIAAPGVNILAAWGGAPPTADPSDDRKTSFNIISGTSMACPHGSGLLALLHAAHPKWSPAAIKSALMTTARRSDNLGKPILDAYDGKAATPFDYGAGHVDPNAALDPGLVYDISVQDYIDLLCSLRYGKKELAIFSRGKYKCSDRFEEMEEGRNLNYPAFAVDFKESAEKQTMKLRRAVTNVGASPSVYRAEVEEPAGVQVKVVPPLLSFSAEGERKSFEVQVSFSPNLNAGDADRLTRSHAFGLLTWVEKQNSYKVGSTIAVTWS